MKNYRYQLLLCLPNEATKLVASAYSESGLKHLVKTRARLVIEMQISLECLKIFDSKENKYWIGG